MEKFLRILALLAGFATYPAVVHGQGVPGGGTVRVLVSAALGGPADTAIRLILPKLRDALGQTVIVENKPGANGQIAARDLMNAAPDGKTLMVGHSGTHAIFPSLYRKVPYDPVRDFAPIVLINTTGLVLTARPEFPASSLSDLVAMARKEPGKFDIGAAGATGEIAIESLMVLTKMRLTIVRYKGAAPTETAILGGEVMVALLPPLNLVPRLAAGKLKALGVTTPARLPLLPAVPTMAELGVADYDFQLWNALFAPAGTPDPVVRTLHKAVAQALDAEARERFAALGFITVAGTPEELAATIERELERYRKLVADLGIARD